MITNRISSLHSHGHRLVRTKVAHFSTPTSPQCNVFARSFRWYTKQLDRRPMLTKVVTSGLIAGAGDTINQLAIEQRPWRTKKDGSEEVYEPKRTVRFAFLGAFLVAPVIHLWYGRLIRLFPCTTPLAVLKRVTLDQFLFSPLFLPVWLTSLWVLEDDWTPDAPERLLQICPPIQIMNWAVWIPGMALNFAFIPHKFHVLASNFIGLFWNAYLSYRTSREHHAHQEHMTD